MPGVSNKSSLTASPAEERAGGGRLGGRRQRLHGSLSRLMSPLHVVLDTLRTRAVNEPSRSFHNAWKRPLFKAFSM